MCAAAAKVVEHRMAYEPRAQQREIHEALRRFSVVVAHRRLGKTVLAINQLISSALRCTLPNPRYAYVAPLRNQAKNVAWDYLKEFTEPFRDGDPNIAELWCPLFNGARITLFGADNPNALRGVYWDGVVLDEYADMAPDVWTQVVRPALSDRRGWALFIGTPKGQDAFYDLYQSATNDSDWYAGMFKASETGIIDEVELQANRKAMTPEEYAQEFECSFSAPNIGSYYGSLIAEAENEKRICRVPWEPSVLVSTGWDLGKSDSTAIWFSQQVGREVRIIDYYENSGPGLDHYAQVVRGKRYVYDYHYLPHDAAVSELAMGTGVTRVETLQSLGINPTVVPIKKVEEGINAVKMLLPKCYFDAEKTTLAIPSAPGSSNKLRGLPSLRSYRRDWLPKNGIWRDVPRHDWASDGADAFRILATGLRPPASSKPLSYPKGAYV